MTKMQLALIEDNADQRQVLTAMLDDIYDVQSFDSYHSARHAMIQSDACPDVILCDISLPDGNGLALRQDMLAHDRMVSCPFIFLTGYSTAVNRQWAAGLSIDDFLSKPVERDILLTAINRTLTRNKTLRQHLNKRLDCQLTETLQPALPDQIGPYRLSLSHRDSTAGGGDFAFHFTSNDSDFILIGDVMGHGAPAKYFLHSYIGYLYGVVQSFHDRKLNPAASDLMNLLNTVAADDTLLKRWPLTCLAICIAPDGQMTMANGGHVFPWLVQNEQVNRLRQHGPMPGILKDIIYDDVAINLSVGQKLYIGTDGIRFDNNIDLSRMNARNYDINDDATLVMIERV